MTWHIQVPEFNSDARHSDSNQARPFAGSAAVLAPDTSEGTLSSLAGGQNGRISVLALETQVIREDLIENVVKEMVPVTREADGQPETDPLSIRILSSVPDLARAIPTVKDGYLVFSLRPGLIWDRHLLKRIAAEIAAVEDRGIPWFCLCADGADIHGDAFSAAFFNFEPTLVPDRGRRLVVQTTGTLLVVKAESLRDLDLRPVVWGDLGAHVNALITMAYARGLATVFSSGLYPCLAEHRSLHYPPLADALAVLNPHALMHATDATELFPVSVPRLALLNTWVEMMEAALRVRHSFSFVVRTLFRRSHLLRRCLISIEYLRSTLEIDVEIVLATDVPDDVVEPELRKLRDEFPKLTFVVAHSAGQSGFSRVRNLVAGLRATTGSRVCIIDDDDYYAPQAVKCLEQACAFDTDNLVIFDTQIIGERWIPASTKWHKEIVSYDTCFQARSWTTTLRASNSIPLCGVIHPGWFVREVTSQYVFDFDLSEDFIFHLMCFAHPKRPSVKVVEGVCAYQSHRAGDDNVSNVKDRTGWVVDTGNGLYQLLFEQGRTFDVVSAGEVGAGEVDLRRRLAFVEAELVNAERARTQATQLLAKLIQQVTPGPR